MAVLLVGDGRLATSLVTYLPVYGISVAQWSRRREADGHCPSVRALAADVDTVLIAITDDAITEWATAHAAALEGKTLIHFSGALVAEGLSGYHPLYAFPKTTVPQDVMATIPFVYDAEGLPFAEVFPTLPNPSFALPQAQKPLYHALAVLTGNLATYVWNRAAITMDDQLSLPPAELLVPYYQSLIRNFEASPFDSLTGPVKRKDITTVNRNLDALREQEALKRLYEAFLEAAWQS